MLILLALFLFYKIGNSKFDTVIKPWTDLLNKTTIT